MVPHQQCRHPPQRIWRKADSQECLGSPMVKTLTTKGTVWSLVREPRPANRMAKPKKEKKENVDSWDIPQTYWSDTGMEPEVVFQQDFQVTLMHTKDWKTPVQSFSVSRPWIEALTSPALKGRTPGVCKAPKPQSPHQRPQPGLAPYKVPTCPQRRTKNDHHLCSSCPSPDV